MNFKKLAIVAVMTALTPAVASAQTFLTNWKLDADKDGSFVNVSEFLDLVGSSYVVNTPTGGTGFTFTDDGFFQVAGRDSQGPFALRDANDGIFPSTEITTTFIGATGSGNFGGGITFAPGGLLNIYADPAFDYGSTNGLYGANNGDLIGTFELVSGSGAVDPTGIPNGLFTLIFRAIQLDTGVFLDSNNNDLSTLVGGPDDILFGFVTTNASFVSNPDATLISELSELVGAPVVNGPPGSLVISNNGQFRLSVPEPTSMALLGFGLLGFGLSRRKQRG